MAKVYITEHTRPILRSDPLGFAPQMPPVAEQTVTIGATSAASSAFNVKTCLIGVHTDAICSIAIGANPTAAATNKRMAANSTEYFEVFPGHKLAVITNT